MSIWIIMNWVAWLLCVLLIALLLKDFIKIELEMAKNKKAER